MAGGKRGAGQTMTSVTSVTSGPVIPGMPGGTVAASTVKPASSRYQRSQPAAAAASATGTAAQQAFINDLAPGAIAAQNTYGVPAAVTIAQAIDESAWGQSSLAAQDNNLFGIKGTGPAGSVSLPTQEFENGQWVTITAQFRMYNNVAESIADHASLLATSGYYGAAMANRQAPNSFAQALTGVYATDPNYGNTLVGLMRRYNLYRFDPDTQSATAQARAAAHPAPASAAQATAPQTASGSAGQAEIPGLVAAPQPAHAAATPSPPATPPSTVRSSRAASRQVLAPTAKPTATATPKSVRTPAPTPVPATRTVSPQTAAPYAPTSQTMPRHAAASQAAATPGPAVPAQSPASGPAPKPQGSAAAPAVASPRRTPPASAAVATPTGQPEAATPAPTPGSGSAARSSSGSRAPAAPTGTGSPSAGVPHPFATPPAASAPSATPSPAASPAARQNGAEIPGIPAGPSSTGPATAHTSARMRSPSDTRVIAELAAVVRPAQAAGTAGPPATSAARSVAARPGAADALPPMAPAGSAIAPKKTRKKKAAARTRQAAPRYQPQMPAAVKSTFLATARRPLARAELIYRDVAGNCGISWKLLAACDWMQCEANPRYSPVQGEKLGTINPDGTVFRTKSEALTQCAHDLVAVADTVYHIDLTVPVELSVLELANVFAGFRWGGLLKLHNTSAMEFPYSVQGLTDQHTNMRWPRIAEPHAPDKPGGKFRRPFGAVPVVLSLDYPATA